MMFIFILLKVRGELFVFFFFSSRRRHTRCSRDCSDVCSSDLLPSVAFIARISPIRFLRAGYPAMLMGFSATSSMAALPLMIDAADRDLQIPRSVSGFVLPLAATLNRGGSAVFQAI